MVSAERTRLFGGGRLDRQVEDIGAHLHDERGFARDSADGRDGLDRNTLFAEPFDDPARAEHGRFSQRPVDHRSARTEIEPEDGAAQVRIRVRRAAAVEPVEREDAG